MSRVGRIVGMLVGVLLGMAPPLHAASVHFADGLSHTLPGDSAFTNGDWVQLASQSRLVVQASALLTGSPDSSATLAFGGPALTTTPGTIARIVGGEVTGGGAVGVLDESDAHHAHGRNLPR